MKKILALALAAILLVGAQSAIAEETQKRSHEKKQEFLEEVKEKKARKEAAKKERLEKIKEKKQERLEKLK